MVRGKFAKLIASALLVMAMLFASPALSWAAQSGGGGGGSEPAEEDSDPEKARLQKDIQTAALLVMLEIMVGIESALEADMYDEYKDNYKFDHKKLTDIVNPTMYGYETIAREAEGYRYKGSPGGADIYSDIYRQRMNDWHDAITGAAEDNSKEASLLMNNAQKWITDMHNASMNAEGYMQLLQAGTQETNYLNMELLQLRTDNLRRIDIRLLEPKENRQNDIDETSAFDQAIGTWTAAGTAEEY
jgi:hypothetical protein